MKLFISLLLLCVACTPEPDAYGPEPDPYEHSAEARRVLVEAGLNVKSLKCKTFGEDLARCDATTTDGYKRVMCAYGRCEFRKVEP